MLDDLPESRPKYVLPPHTASALLELLWQATKLLRDGECLNVDRVEDDETPDHPIGAVKESGHPIRHAFTRAIPTAQCMNCHMHQPNIFLNSYLGYTGIEYHETDALVERIYRTVDEQQQAQLWRQLGDMMYDRHMTMPLFWTYDEALIDPKVVQSYVYPGPVPGIWSHVENIKAVMR